MEKQIYIKKIVIDGEEQNVELKGIQMKVVDGEEGIVECYVSKFGNVDSYGDIVLKGAFAASIERWKKDGRYPKGIWAHNWEEPIAKTIDMYEDEQGLYIKAQFILSVQRGREAFDLIKEGVITDFSFGYIVNKAEYDANGNRLLKEVTIYEWSPVLVGANPDTEVLSVKSVEAQKDVEEKGVVEDILNARNDPAFYDSQSEKFKRLSNVYRIVYALEAAFMFATVKVEEFPVLLQEVVDMLNGIIAGTEVKADRLAEFEEKAAEMADLLVKEGRTLSEANMTILNNAVESMKSATETIEKLLSSSSKGMESTPDESDAGVETDIKSRRVIKVVQHHMRAAEKHQQSALLTIKRVISKQ